MEILNRLIKNMNDENMETQCKGIRGFLFLPAGSLVAILFILLGLIILNIETLYSSVFNVIIADYPGLKASMISQTIILIMQLVFVVHVSVLFFRKKQELPKMIIAFLTVHLLVMIANVSWIISVYKELCYSEYGGVIVAVFMTAAGIPYFIKSRRVKATFVNP